MEITELDGQVVKIGITSITVKNKETNKTCGIVRNVITLEELKKTPRCFFDIVTKHRICVDTIRDNEDLKYNNLIIDGDKLYYICDLNQINRWNNFIDNMIKINAADLAENEKNILIQSYDAIESLIQYYDAIESLKHDNVQIISAYVI